MLHIVSGLVDSNSTQPLAGNGVHFFAQMVEIATLVLVFPWWGLFVWEQGVRNPGLSFVADPVWQIAEAGQFTSQRNGKFHVLVSIYPGIEQAHKTIAMDQLMQVLLLPHC